MKTKPIKPVSGNPYASGSKSTGTTLKEELKHVKESARKGKHEPTYFLKKPVSGKKTDWVKEFDKRFPVQERYGYWRSQSQRNGMFYFIDNLLTGKRKDLLQIALDSVGEDEDENSIPESNYAVLELVRMHERNKEKERIRKNLIKAFMGD